MTDHANLPATKGELATLRADLTQALAAKADRVKVGIFPQNASTDPFWKWWHKARKQQDKRSAAMWRHSNADFKRRMKKLNDMLRPSKESAALMRKVRAFEKSGKT